jgi:hypothetical protein
MPKGLRDLTVPVERPLLQVRAWVEYPFHVLKNPSLRRGKLCPATRSCAIAGWPRTRRSSTLFALANLVIVKKTCSRRPEPDYPSAQGLS